MDEQIFTAKELMFWGASGLFVLTCKFFSWFMPQTAALWVEKIRKMLTKELSKEVQALALKVDLLIVENSIYKGEKHRLEGELGECIDAIKCDDADKLKVLKEHYVEESLKEHYVEESLKEEARELKVRANVSK